MAIIDLTLLPESAMISLIEEGMDDIVDSEMMVILKRWADGRPTRQARLRKMLDELSEQSDA